MLFLFSRTSIGFGVTILVLTGCSPRIEVTPPTAPITINLNVKIDHEIHINVDKEVELLISSSPELFQ